MSARTLIFLLALLVLAGCKDNPDQGSADKKADAAGMAVSVAPVARETISHGVVATGPVSAWEEMQLGVELSGLRVISLPVDVGQQVRRGQVLLELDHRMLDSELNAARSAVGEARVGVELAQASMGRGWGKGGAHPIIRARGRGGSGRIPGP